MDVKFYRFCSIIMIRIFLASIFIMAGIGKLFNSHALFQRLDSYSPIFLQNIYGVVNLLPYIELFVGLIIMFGLCLKFGALASILLSLMFLAAHLMDYFREEYFNCGCFGDIIELNPALSITLDLAILISAIILYSLLFDISTN